MKSVTSLVRRVSVIVPILVLVGGYRASLVGRGAMADWDEQWYYRAGMALAELKSLNVPAAIRDITSNDARPGNALIQLVPAALQGIPYAYGVSPSNPQSLMIPVTCIVVVSLTTLYLVWRISLLLFDDDRLASAIAVVIYGLLLNSNVYLRHVLAYEPALCVGMWALWLALAGPLTGRRPVAIGCLSGFMVTVYPYYLFPLIVGTAVVWGNALADPERRLARSIRFGAGGALVIAAMELFSWIGGVSYFDRVRERASLQGYASFDESWSFVPRYLLQVEGAAGVMLLCGVIAYGARVVSEIRRGARLATIHWLVLAAAACWLWQVVASAYLQRIAFYGRLIHPWMPFLVWALVHGIRETTRGRARVLVSLSAVGVSIVSWATWAPELARVAYPADVLYSMGINTALLPQAQRPCYVLPEYPYRSPPPLNRETGYPYSPRTDYVLINFCQGVPPAVEPAETIAIDPTWRLLLRAPHFMAFRAWSFEGLRPEDREAIRRPVYWMQVYATSGTRK